MLHIKVGFPDNPPYKILPSKKHYHIIFSPNMATGDASPADFRSFEWATNWLPHQMELEYKDKANYIQKASSPRLTRWLTACINYPVLHLSLVYNTRMAAATGERQLWRDRYRCR